MFQKSTHIMQRLNLQLLDTKSILEILLRHYKSLWAFSTLFFTVFKPLFEKIAFQGPKTNKFQPIVSRR